MSATLPIGFSATKLLSDKNMVRPKVDSRLQNIEKGIEDIKEKLCEIHPCDSHKEEVSEEEEK